MGTNDEVPEAGLSASQWLRTMELDARIGLMTGDPSELIRLLEQLADWLREEGHASVHVQAAIARIRQTKAWEEALGVCDELCTYQRVFEKLAEQPDMMPGNQQYSDRAMAIVRRARAVLARATTTSPDESPAGRPAAFAELLAAAEAAISPAGWMNTRSRDRAMQWLVAAVNTVRAMLPPTEDAP
jgi:hypothetical protein